MKNLIIPGSQSFGQTHDDVGRDARLLTGDQRPGPAPPSEHFVREEEHAVPRTDFPHCPQCFRAVDVHTSSAQNQRQNNEGGRRRRLLIINFSLKISIKINSSFYGGGRG